MKRILREPLFHFLLLGAAIFLLYGLVVAESFTTDQVVLQVYPTQSENPKLDVMSII